MFGYVHLITGDGFIYFTSFGAPVCHKSSTYCSATLPLHVVCMWCLRTVPGITSFLSHTKEYYHLRHISFKIVSLCNYILLSASVKVLKTLLEAILRKPFRLFRRILNDISAITVAPSLYADFNRGGQVKIRWSQVRGVGAMFHCCHIVLC